MQRELPFAVTVQEEGMYGFRLVPRTGSGGGKAPPAAGDPAHVWVTTSHLGDEATTLFSSEDGGLTWHAVGLSALS